MANTTIKLRRGSDLNQSNVVPADGEPVYDKANNKLYIGDGTKTLSQLNNIGGDVSVTLNGSATTNPSFYAPVLEGTSGQILKSNGSNSAPTWVNQSTLSVASATTAASATYAASAGSATTASTASMLTSNDFYEADYTHYTYDASSKTFSFDTSASNAMNSHGCYEIIVSTVQASSIDTIRETSTLIVSRGSSVHTKLCGGVVYFPGQNHGFYVNFDLDQTVTCKFVPINGSDQLNYPQTTVFYIKTLSDIPQGM